MINNQIDIHKCLRDVFGHSEFRPNQEAIIQNTLEGKNSLVIMPTGIGKSLCYQLPALISDGMTIVISPLIALMKSQIDDLRFKTESDSIVQAFNSTLTVGQLRALNKYVEQRLTKIVYISPESLLKETTINLFKKIKISFIAVDEAHCISEWGTNFRPDYRKIASFIKEINQPVPIMALTATATEIVRKDIISNLEMKNPNTFRFSFNRPNLFYEIKYKSSNFEKHILKFIISRPKQAGIVYCMSRKKVEEFSEFLILNGIKAAGYHAGMSNNDRTEIQEKFINDETQVIVATIAFGMGIDKPNVRFIVHYDVSKSLESYYQETGRAGRDGLQAHCLAYCSDEDFKKFSSLLRKKNSASKKAKVLMLDEIIEYSHSSLCRRKQILHYFGEDFIDQCNKMCDNCSKKLETRIILDDLISIIQVIKDRPFELKSETLIYFLNGLKLDDFDTDGRGKKEKEFLFEKDYKFWRSLIRFATINNFLSRNVEDDYSYAVSEKGDEYLKTPYKIEVPMSKGLEEDSEESFLEGEDKLRREPKESGGEHFDPDLYSILERKRKEMAKQFNVPPFVIFQDSSLEEMCIFYPNTVEKMQLIGGVGKSKANKYGKPFIEIIVKYVDDNDIEISDNIQVRSSGQKSKLKISIINAIDRKVDLIDFAESNKIEFDGFLNEVESIVFGGTKLNLDFFIYAEMDREKVQEIYDYFKTATTDSMEKALRELDEEVFTMEEIRLVRLKFMSELAN